MLTIETVGRVYPNGTRALDRVSLSIGSGEIVAIVGGSGCGKSTLLRLVSGLDHATEGRVVVDGTEIADPHPAVGIVFQEPRLLPWLTVADNVAFGIQNAPKAERQAHVNAALAKVGLSEHANRWPRELSGGQAQRVAIARALVPKPTVLLLDEPFSALDAFTRADLQDHLLDLWAEFRPTLVLVTHDIEEAVVLADRVIVMRPKPGRLAAEFRIESSRPRDRLSPEFEDVKRRILRSLDETLTVRPRGEELAPAAAI